MTKGYAEASAEGLASHLMRLALVFTQRQLDVQKAFADLDEQKHDSITPVQLVCSPLLLYLRCVTGHELLLVLFLEHVTQIHGLLYTYRHHKKQIAETRCLEA